MIRRLLAAVAVLLVSAGCVDAAPDQDVVAEATPVSVLAESPERRIRDLTVRVRSRGCPDTGIGTGSGFMLDEHRIITNRHVVAGADHLVVTTWDGHDEVVEVVSAATVSDLAVVEVAGTLPTPVALGEDPEVGDAIHAAGYPEGGEFHLSSGTVTGYDGRVDPNEDGEVIAVDARVRPGNSGGPLLDAEGRLVGVVYAIRSGDSAGLAIPVSRLAGILERDGLDPVEPCSARYVPQDQRAGEAGIGSGTVPTPPSTTTTTIRDCPTGEPEVTITDVRSTPRPAPLEGFDTTVEGTVTNEASAPVRVAAIEIELAHDDGTTGIGRYFVADPIPPGATAQFSGPHSGGGSRPTAGGEVRLTWQWEDLDDRIHCGGR